MSESTLVAFWAFSLLFVFTPGADWAYAISAGIRNRGVGASVLGLLGGYVVLTILIAAGVGVLIAGHPVLMAILTVAGAIYLAWLGYGMLRNPPIPHADSGAENGGNWMTWFRQGALVSGLRRSSSSSLSCRRGRLKQLPGASPLKSWLSAWFIRRAARWSIQWWASGRTRHCEPVQMLHGS